MFSGKSEQRILQWRDFRQSLSCWPQDIHQVANMWAKCPQINHYLDYNSEWPDAWTLVKDGMYCDISIALGIYYTLYYSSYTGKDTMEIHHYHLREKHQLLNLVFLPQEKYMRNYSVGEVVNTSQLTHIGKPQYVLNVKNLPIKS